MIVARTPFRISFAGGGSDLPSFYRQAPGAVVSTTIDKYMYVAIHPYFHNKLRVRYAKTEDVDSIEQIQHPLVRESLKLVGHSSADERGMEIASFADVPAGTGMGSSSSFTVCVLHALHAIRGEEPNADRLAREACEVEIDRAKEPIGKQDQYAAAFGGLNLIEFNPDETVKVLPVRCPEEVRRSFEQHLMMFYVGQERSASDILRRQGASMSAIEKFQQVEKIVALSYELRDTLERGDVTPIGDLLDRGWQIKSKLAAGISDPKIDSYYSAAKNAGASGGKLLGAGGGGFLLIFCEPTKQAAVRAALGLREMRFRFSTEGSRILYQDETSTSLVPPLPSAAPAG
jgi:D-glycero-alpha-D-manno-heptose-7-phosphate kinase